MVDDLCNSPSLIILSCKTATKGVIQKGMQIPMLVTVVDACLKTQ
jgi:hypothetical protein